MHQAIRLPLSGVDMRRFMLMGLALASISSAHYLSLDRSPFLHELSQRAYYLPIIYAAYRYGVRGGALAAMLSVALFVPHVHRHVDAQVQLNQYSELFVFLIIGSAAGVLFSKEKREQRRYRKTARELRRVNKKLQETIQQLIRADRFTSLGQISAGIVHEIRNPLASIRGALQALESEIEPEHPRYDFLELMQEELERLDRISTEFLRYARPSSPRLDIVGPGELLRRVASLIAREADRCGVQVDIEVAPRLPKVLLDDGQIQQVLLNLAINGLQAMPEGGFLELTAELARGTAGLVLRVRDHGAGVAPEVRERLFEPFFTTKEGGTGLGLAIAERLVRQHRGTIRVLEAPGGGAAFEVVLPLREAAEGSALVGHMTKPGFLQ